MARFVLPSPLFLAKRMRTVDKKMGSHSIFGHIEYRGKTECPIFGRFTNHCIRRFFHGPVYLFLLGYALGPLVLQPSALADWTTSDRDTLNNLVRISQDTEWNTQTSATKLESIESETFEILRHTNYEIIPALNTLYGISNLVAKIAKAVSNQLDLTQIEQDLEDSLTELKQLNNNMGYLAEGTALENSDGQGYDNLISGINYGSRSMSMADSLQLIGQAVGGLGTSFGPHTQDNATLPLIRTILGWTSGYASNNIQTNGIIGLLQSINREVVKLHTMTNPIISSIEKQTESLTNYLAKFEQTFATFAINQTNLMWSTIFSTDPPFYDPIFLSDNFNGNYNIHRNAAAQNWLALLPLYTVPYDGEYDEIADAYGQAAYNTIYYTDPGDTDYKLVKDLFYKYYGNLRSYNAVFSDEAGDIEETREGASNLVAQSTEKTTNVVVRLIPELTVTDLMSPWGDLTTFQNDWKNTKGPSKEDYDRIKGYYQESMQESEESATFQFDITFGEGTEIHTEEVYLIPDDSVIGNIKTKANNLVAFMCSTCRAILLLIFVWRMLEAALSVMNGNGVDS